MMTPEQMTAANKANFEVLFGLTKQAFTGMERLVELNLAATKAAMTETAAHTQAIMGVKDVQYLVALQASVYQPMTEKAVSYTRHVYEIASSTGAELTKAAEEKAAEAQKAFVSAIDGAAKNAPAGTESVVAMFKTAVAAGNNALESVQKTVKQASELAESNIQAVANTAVATGKTSKKR
ncbi:MAG: phasin family protein [Limnohabitans sp.]|nr:phasin family protein [Limnohabitans sp.]